ncbi:hypothetical protein QVD17_08941 [Tagetes erecta]|uniref:DUF1985 domain-containing protein n=1 Tax=Tagetes erecta TaxID=13708 RepID=A0AAD8KZL3_TARER|nr:hypothetical protein QVD17_08941 [Tagetes erecta]
MSNILNDLVQEPKPVDPEYFGLTYKFPDGSQFNFGPHEYCLLTGFSFGNNESILEELWKNTDCVKFKESVIDTYINKEPTVNELYDFINRSSQMLQDDEKLVKLCVLLYLYSFLMGVENTKKIEPLHMFLVNDFDDWNRFNWGSYFWSRTVKSLTDTVFKRAAKPPKGWMYSLTGFVWPFKLWVYEILPYFATLTKREVAIPRALGWSENNILLWPSILKILVQSFKSGSAFSPRRLFPTDDERNEVWWIDSCAYIQEMYDLKVKSTGQNVGCGKDDDSPPKNFEFEKVSSLDDNEFVEDENFDIDNLNFEQQGFLNSLLNKENINANANPNPNQTYNATTISNDHFQELLNSVQRILQNQNIQDTFYKGYLDREAKSFMKTSLQRQDEIYQTLLDISSNSKLEPEMEIEDVQGDLGKDVPNMSADDMRTPAMQSIPSIQSEPRRRKSKRQRFPSRYYVTPFRPLENTPRIEKQKNKNSIADSELEELCGRSYYWIWSTLLPHYAIDSEFWRVLLGKQAGGWIEDEHINCWINYLLLNRPEDATWTIMPSQLLLNTNGGNWQMDYGSGSYAPFPSIEYINTWLLANDSEAYNSYRQPPFVRVVPTFVPQQSGLLEDCGVWVCIFLDRRIKGEPFFQEQEDTAISTMDFRLKLGRLILETKFKEEEKRNNDRGD